MQSAFTNSCMWMGCSMNSKDLIEKRRWSLTSQGPTGETSETMPHYHVCLTWNSKEGNTTLHCRWLISDDVNQHLCLTMVVHSGHGKPPLLPSQTVITIQKGFHTSVHAMTHMINSGLTTFENTCKGDDPLPGGLLGASPSAQKLCPRSFVPRVFMAFTPFNE